MHDEIVACRELCKVSLDCVVGGFGTSQLERTTSFPNASNRTRDSFSNVPIRACDADIMSGLVITIIDKITAGPMTESMNE